MNKDTINRTIAEACGWHYEDDGDYLWLMRPDGSRALGHGRRPKIHPWMEDAFALPRYTNCLNDCHKMEKTLSQSQRDSYEVNLENIVDPNGDSYWSSATATQRCEAFLRTLNLWTPTGEENE